MTLSLRDLQRINNALDKAAKGHHVKLDIQRGDVTVRLVIAPKPDFRRRLQERESAETR